MSKHTPGPWYIDAKTIMVIRASDSLIAMTAGLPDDELTQQELANARLIAAAPDLLAALEAMVIRYGWGHNEADPEMKHARAVIAKATGDK